ncbi:hypothetical protein GGX14DRAFT_669601 [Mycena pura]|uniref:Uncharacterized protein n=1 Tax=Mycena pura TaxID=153505 RepID=A0AAD6YH71_9AGAR|nr:hypothetical protein GGX14DRAFT_669601 [Mycena pura]
MRQIAARATRQSGACGSGGAHGKGKEEKDGGSERVRVREEDAWCDKIIDLLVAGKIDLLVAGTRARGVGGAQTAAGGARGGPQAWRWRAAHAAHQPSDSAGTPPPPLASPFMHAPVAPFEPVSPGAQESPGVAAEAVHVALVLAQQLVASPSASASPVPVAASASAGTSAAAALMRPPHSSPRAPARLPPPPPQQYVPTHMRRDTISLPIAPGAGAGVGYQHPSRARGAYTYPPPYAHGLGPGPASQYSGAAHVQA